MAKRPSGLERAIEIAGSQANLAEALGTSRQLVHSWKAKGVVPVKWMIAVERQTGVPRWELRPDLYETAA